MSSKTCDSREIITAEIEAYVQALETLGCADDWNDPGIYYDYQRQAAQIERHIEDLMHQLDELEAGQ
jgi:hypothetical protein